MKIRFKLFKFTYIHFKSFHVTRFIFNRKVTHP